MSLMYPRGAFYYFMKYPEHVERARADLGTAKKFGSVSFTWHSEPEFPETCSYAEHRMSILSALHRALAAIWPKEPGAFVPWVRTGAEGHITLAVLPQMCPEESPTIESPISLDGRLDRFVVFFDVDMPHDLLLVGVNGQFVELRINHGQSQDRR